MLGTGLLLTKAGGTNRAGWHSGHGTRWLNISPYTRLLPCNWFKGKSLAQRVSPHFSQLELGLLMQPTSLGASLGRFCTSIPAPPSLQFCANPVQELTTPVRDTGCNPAFISFYYPIEADSCRDSAPPARLQVLLAVTKSGL